MANKNLIKAICLLNSEFFFNEPFEDEISSSSDDEDDTIAILLANAITRKRKLTTKKVPIRIKFYMEHVIPNYSNREFQSHFRITRVAYEALLHSVGPSLKKQQDGPGRHTINVEKQLLAVIWLLATPDSYRSVGERFDMGKSSLSVSFVRVIHALNNISKLIITWPTGEQLENTEQKFYNIAGLRNVIGAVDGTYVPIKAPKNDKEIYVTRKCNFAITLQAISDANLKFSDVFVGYPGSVSDSRIFRNSDIYKNILRNPDAYFARNQFIIGDKAYPTLAWCIPPYIDRGNLTPAKRYFNLIISKTRQTVERSFALLFGRFRRLKYLDMNRIDLVPATVLASCVLHNICLNHEDLLLDEYIIEGANAVLQDDDAIDIVGQNQQEVVMQEGRNRRDELCQMLYRANN